MKAAFKKIVFLGAAVYFSAVCGAQAEGKIRIASTTTTFSNIAQEITKDKAEFYSVASPKRDIHFISPTPKDVLKVKKSDVFINGGLDLEAWRAPLLDAVGRTDLMWPAGERQIDVSRGIELLEVPDSLSRSEGDIHVYGNPHYWTDPENGKVIAQNIARGLSRLYPEDADFFQKNAEVFEAKLDEKIKEWSGKLLPYKGAKVLTYHRSWPYFLKRFGLVSAGEIEPKPGIPPTAKHLQELEQKIKAENIKIIIRESYFEGRTAEKLAKSTGASVLVFSQAVGEQKDAADYISMIDSDVSILAEALAKAAQ